MVIHPIAAEMFQPGAKRLEHGLNMTHSSQYLPN